MTEGIGQKICGNVYIGSDPFLKGREALLRMPPEDRPEETCEFVYAQFTSVKGGRRAIQINDEPKCHEMYLFCWHRFKCEDFPSCVDWPFNGNGSIPF